MTLRHPPMPSRKLRHSPAPTPCAGRANPMPKPAQIRAPRCAKGAPNTPPILRIMKRGASGPARASFTCHEGQKA